MPRLLILSPHFPPTNAADHQRVRLYLPHLLALGWEITVLCVDPSGVAAPQDALLATQTPTAVRVLRVRALPLWLGRLLRRRSLSWRALGALRRAGDALLRGERFDLLYVSTTQFGVCRLALRWQEMHGLPYAFDLQDPWISDHFERHPQEAPPGGRLKFALAQAGARRWEPRVLGAAAAITVVSPHYRDMLLKRYPQLRPERVLTLPFGVDAADFELLERSGVAQHYFDPADGCEHWVYVGRGGADLHPVLGALFAALARWRDSEPLAASRVRLHFIGTSYAAADQAEATIQPLAQAAGVADLVSEYAPRIPYLQALRCLRDASALMLPASSDQAYQPSKLHLCLLAGRPVLAMLRRDGPVYPTLREVRGVCLLAGDAPAQELANAITAHWLLQPQQRQTRPEAETWLAPHTAAAAAARLHALLLGVLAPHSHPSP